VASRADDEGSPPARMWGSPGRRGGAGAERLHEGSGAHAWAPLLAGCKPGRAWGARTGESDPARGARTGRAVGVWVGRGVL